MAVSMRIVSRIANNDFRLYWKERSIFIWVFVMPVAFMFFFGLAMRSSSDSTVRASLLVEDRDGGFLSAALIEALRAEHLAIADSVPAQGTPLRVLRIPEGFTRKVLSRERVTLALERRSSANTEASEVVSVSVFRALVRVAVGLVEVEAGVIDAGAPGIAIEGDTLLGSLWEAARSDPSLLGSVDSRLDTLLAREPLVTVDTRNAGRAREIPMGFQGSVPGNLVMFVLMAMVFSGTAVTVERTEGLLARLGTSPADRFEIIAGKLLGRIYLALLQIAVLLLFGRFAFGISLGNSPAALALLMIAFAYCTGSFGMLFGSLFSNPDQVTGFAIITTLTMAALGGCWWPIEVVSKPFKVIAFLLPTGWAINGIHRIISFGMGFADVAAHVLLFLLAGTIFIWLASRRLRWF